MVSMSAYAAAGVRAWLSPEGEIAQSGLTLALVHAGLCFVRVTARGLVRTSKLRMHLEKY